MAWPIPRIWDDIVAGDKIIAGNRDAQRMPAGGREGEETGAVHDRRKNAGIERTLFKLLDRDLL